jgi:hypothetical protein
LLAARGLRPDDFIPVPDGWQDRSAFIAQEGLLSFRHFDFVAQALAKIERGHAPAIDPPAFRRALEDALVSVLPPESR